MSDGSDSDRFPEEAAAETYSAPIRSAFAAVNQEHAPVFTSTPTKTQPPEDDEMIRDSEAEEHESQEDDSDVIEILDDSEEENFSHEEVFEKDEEPSIQEEGEATSDSYLEESEASDAEADSDIELAVHGTDHEDLSSDGEAFEQQPTEPTYSGFQDAAGLESSAQHALVELNQDDFLRSELAQSHDPVTLQSTQADMLNVDPDLRADPIPNFFHKNEDMDAQEIHNALATLANSAELMDVMEFNEHLDSLKIPHPSDEQPSVVPNGSTGFEFGTTIGKDARPEPQPELTRGEHAEPAREESAEPVGVSVNGTPIKPHSFLAGQRSSIFTPDTSVNFTFGQSFIHEPVNAYEPEDVSERVVEDATIDDKDLRNTPDESQPAEAEPAAYKRAESENRSVNEDETESLPLSAPILFPVTASVPTSVVGYSFGESFHNWPEKPATAPGRSLTTESIQSTPMFGSFGASVWNALNAELSPAKYEPPGLAVRPGRPNFSRTKSMPLFKPKVQELANDRVSPVHEVLKPLPVNLEKPVQPFGANCNSKVDTVEIDNSNLAEGGIESEPSTLQPSAVSPPATTHSINNGMKMTGNITVVKDRAPQELSSTEPQHLPVQPSTIEGSKEDVVNEVYHGKDDADMAVDESEVEEVEDAMDLDADEVAEAHDVNGDVEMDHTKYVEYTSGDEVEMNEDSTVRRFVDDEAEEESEEVESEEMESEAEESEESEGNSHIETALAIASQQEQMTSNEDSEGTSNSDAQEYSSNESSIEVADEPADNDHLSEMVDPALFEQAPRASSPSESGSDESDSDESVVFLDQTGPLQRTQTTSDLEEEGGRSESESENELESESESDNGSAKDEEESDISGEFNENDR